MFISLEINLRIFCLSQKIENITIKQYIQSGTCKCMENVTGLFTPIKIAGFTKVYSKNKDKQW